MSQTVTAALSRLFDATEAARKGFPDLSWSKVSGPGPESLVSGGIGAFEGLVLEGGKDLELVAKLTLPASSQHCPIGGQVLEATLNSLYPVEIYWNDDLKFEAGGVPVAAGPALFVIVPELKVGDNDAIRIRIKMPNNQATNWFGLYLTTPALRARTETIDVAWAQLSLADAFATGPKERNLVERAAAAIPDDVAGTATEELVMSFGRMVEILAPLSGKITSGPRVHLIGHCHIDMNWLWTQKDTDNTIVRDFKSVLSLLDDYPELTFSHSQPATYEIFRREEPALFEKVLSHIKSGRWEATTMQWVEGDVNMASGEGQARQLLHGVQYTKEELGVTPEVFHAPDTFGHAGNLPQLAVSAGAKYYYHHRANEGQENQWPAYWWEGQDGSRILAMSTYQYNGEITARDIATTAIRAKRFGHPAGMHFHGIGDHGGGPVRQNMEVLRRFVKMPLLPPVLCSSEAAYAREIVESGCALPVHYGESATIFEGCYTTHADAKYYNRAGENMLTTADSLAAIASQDGRETLNVAWRKILFNQFHDILDGSAIHESYEQNKADFDEAKQCADRAIESALAVLITPGESVTIVNPLGFEREDWVEVSGMQGIGSALAVGDSGHQAVGQYGDGAFGFVARVPAFGTAAYHIRPLEAAPFPSLQADLAFAPTQMPIGGILEKSANEGPYLLVDTPVFKAYVRRDCGVIVSLFDKRVERQLVAFGLRRASDYIDSARPDLALNVFQLVEEHPHGMSSWQYQEVWSEQSLLKGATTEVMESGPARLVLQVSHNLRSSRITQKIIFYRDLARIDFETDIDWREIGDSEKGVPNLKAAFTARLPEAEAWFETPFAAIRRPADGMECPAIRWADVGGATYGIAVLNDSKYGYDALGNRLRLTLVRSGYEPDTISDLGEHHIRYALLPHVGGWQDAGVVRAGLGFNQPLIGRLGSASNHIRPTLRLMECNSIILASVKIAANGLGIVARMYESAGKAGHARLTGWAGGAVVTEVNVVEEPLHSLDGSKGDVCLAFRPWQVRSVLIEPSSDSN